MKKILVILILAAIRTMVCGAELTPKEVGKLKIPGEKVLNSCFLYAWELNGKLADNGMESRVIKYTHSKGTKAHAVLLFSSKGKEYIIDNELDRAIRVRGTTDLEKVKSFDRNAERVEQIALVDMNRLAQLLGK